MPTHRILVFKDDKSFVFIFDFTIGLSVIQTYHSLFLAFNSLMNYPMTYINYSQTSPFFLISSLFSQEIMLFTRFL